MLGHGAGLFVFTGDNAGEVEEEDEGNGDKTTVKRLSCITLIIMGFGGLLLAVSEICGGFLPDIAVRIIGIADIICLTLFVFLFVLVSRK